MEVSRVGKLADVGQALERLASFVHDALMNRGKPFKLHDDVPHCHH
jgi:hypothetical protein